MRYVLSDKSFRIWNNPYMIPLVYPTTSVHGPSNIGYKANVADFTAEASSSRVRDNCCRPAILGLRAPLSKVFRSGKCGLRQPGYLRAKALKILLSCDVHFSPLA